MAELSALYKHRDVGAVQCVSCRGYFCYVVLRWIQATCFVLFTKTSKYSIRERNCSCVYNCG